MVIYLYSRLVGEVTRFVGNLVSSGSVDGYGSFAHFDAPSGITIDVFGQLYVSDSSSNLIRLVTPQGISFGMLIF